MKSASPLKMQGLTVYIFLQLPGACEDMAEKNVDKIKIGDNIINSYGEIVSGIVKWFSPEKGPANPASIQYRSPTDDDEPAKYRIQYTHPDADQHQCGAAKHRKQIKPDGRC